MPVPRPAAFPILAIDTGSPNASVAVLGADGEFHTAQCPQRLSSARILGMIEEALERARTARRELSGIAVALGPGSFTGLRIGLATTLGLQQALSIPVTGVPTLRALARGLDRPAPGVLALVDALRDACFVQRFAVAEDPTEIGPARRVSVDEVVGGMPSLALVAQDLDFVRRRGELGDRELFEIEILAPAVAREALAQPLWDPESLIRPLYLTPPPAKLPGSAAAA